MCGISGRFHAAALPPDPAWHQRAAALLAHRGPDGYGHYADRRCELVHRRLAIIDLSAAGRQPMPNEDGSIQVVFNGEIYNHRELRSELVHRGHAFRSRSDTEVLAHLYEDEGEGLVSRLAGIFALAVWDRRRSRLVLARDRFGVKPLFYGVSGGQWVFASEIKAILALPGFPRRIDRQACYDFMGLGYIPEPATGFADIQALQPGTVLTVDASGCRATRYYRALARPDPARDFPGTVEEAGDRVLAAVRRQAVADVPVAALLSGGIDSSLVVAAHRKGTGEITRTFNVAFPDRDHDETAVARAVAAHYGTDHQTVKLSETVLTPDAVLDLLRHFDQPFADTSLIPMYWIAREIRQHGIVCALSGDGGDEAFGGYETFSRATALARLMGLPGWGLQAAGAVGAWLAPRTQAWGRRIAKAARLARESRADSAVLLAGLANYLTEDQKEAWVPPAARDALVPVYRLFDGYQPAGVTDLEELSRRLTERLFAVGLPGDMLRKVDMMSMRVGLEVRVPLLDEDVADLGLALPHRFKTDGHTCKRVLRGLARRWLPRAVAEHPKHGFSIPLDVMLPRDFHDAAWDLLHGSGARTRGVFADALLADWLRRFRAARTAPQAGPISREGLSQRVFIALALELWLRDHRLTW